MNDFQQGVPPDATIVIAQHRHLELTGNCLAGLRRHDATCWPVIVVDDGSPAEDLEKGDFRAQPNVRQLSQQRQGVSAAWNLGAAEAVTPYIVFLNNDTVSSGPWVDRLLEPLRAGRCLMTGVATRVERALPARILAGLSLRTFLEGWCFAVSSAQWNAVSGFDESLRVYWSDTDFQLRVGLSARGGSRQPLLGVENLPLRHLGHRTAHDRECVSDRRGVWREDRERFVEKWRRGDLREKNHGVTEFSRREG